MDGSQIFVTHIRRFVPMSSAEETNLLKLVQYRGVRNKEYVLKEGEVCTENVFITKGVLRKYIDTEKGNQQIIQFSIENWWMTDYTSFESGQPSMCNIQAVEDCELIVISKDNLNQIFSEFPLMERYFRKVLQRAFEASLSRLHYIFSYSGEERYQHFVSSFPDFVNRIPQYMLASYLGFTPEFLSKIRSKRN